MVAPANNPFGQAELEYPVDWSFRIIAVTDKTDSVAAAVKKLMQTCTVKKDLVMTSKSRTGTYQTMTFTAKIPSREVMESLDSALKAIDGVKVVI